ncbi:outer membrane beta-barrel protein [Winogradskyella poriferorum]|uniref:outer membrane beta-barrel protein n=1 Tax=Winogradskyella poriferorum TaxID=307627 RepID=UPI003D65EC97
MKSVKFCLIGIVATLLSFGLNAQNLFSEVGIGIGNVIGNEHKLGKAELHFNILKQNNYGQMGIDLSLGGNFIPGDHSQLSENTETLSANDAKFTALTFFYRLPLGKKTFVEPRIGYASLYHSVNTNDESTIKKANFTYGIGLGIHLIERLTLGLRYQFLGTTPDYQGTRNQIQVVSNSEPVDVVLLRISYRFNWDTIF